LALYRRPAEGQDVVCQMNSASRSIPLDFFGIPFGLLGLADCWLVAATFGLAPVTVGRLLVVVAVIVWGVVGFAHLRGMRVHRVGLGAELADPIAGPFASLAVITPMLAAADALYPLSHTTGTVVVDVLIVATVSAGLVGQFGLAEMLFGLGLVSWIVLGRLLLGAPLPAALTPTIAIEVAPAAVASFAMFVIDGHRVDTGVRLLAGYGLLMVIAQLRLLPAYRRLSFMPSFWAFTFLWAAVAFAGMFWLGVTHPTGWRAEPYVALSVISAFIVAIAVRTAVALQRGQLLPSPVATPPAPDTRTLQSIASA
jgi:tellurite resistance protein